ncbi:ABC transporter-like [Trinorchestia longiramus]|nr:ABC transporter-like [Trinorchestia longiramus]
MTAFYYGWELTLVNLSVIPLLTLSQTISFRVYRVFARKTAIQYTKVASMAQEVLSSISTVIAFGGEAKEAKRYSALLEPVRAAGVRENFILCFGYGCIWFFIFSSFSLSFWYGIGLVFESRISGGQYDAASLMVVFFNILMGTISLGNSALALEVITLARVSAVDIFEILKRKSKLDPMSTEGLKPQIVNGDLEFHDVKFEYPSRRDVPVLRGLSLKVRPGETVALVGSSGCGKSTCIQLLQRFYDPKEGSITLDTVDLRELNLGWLRDQIGVVGQEPVLFDTTIEENIRYGRDGLSFDDIVAAAKQANAHDFIMKLPEQYQTQVGNCGTQMSGGQKQRLAIARVLVRQPKILLLDEATSALDNRSEAVVQAALDQVRQGRTTIIVAHRLTTIRSADVIVALRAGKAEEIGTHEELMAKQGLYYSLVTTQISSSEEKNNVCAPETANENASEDPDDLSAGAAQGQQLRLRRMSRSSTFENETQSAAPDLEGEKQSEESASVLLRKLLNMCKGEWLYISFGMVAIVVTGSLYPVFAVIVGDVFGTLSVTDPEEASRLADHHALLLFILAVVALFSFFADKFFFSRAGLTLTMRVRSRTFEAMLRQDKTWFDRRENAVGSLCSRLSSDTASVGEMTGRQLGTVMQAGVVLVLSFALVMYIDWRLGLMSSPFVPLVIYVIDMNIKLEIRQSVKETAALMSASRIAVEAISNVRTVASLHTEERFCAAYEEALLVPHRSSIRSAHIRGILFGVGRNLPFVAHAVVLGLGGIFVHQGSLQYSEVFKVAEALIFCSAMVGETISHTPSYIKAKAAVVRIFQLLERVPAINSDSTAEKLTEELEEVRLHDVHFRYPNREEVKILQGLSLTVQKGKTLALVGPSGCGKSTVVSLIERFYDPEKGKLTFNGKDLCKLNAGSVRQKVGLVSQEPLLFDLTIRENIAYGDNSREVSHSDIVAAAQQANISSFIDSLPEKYNTRVGSKGFQLSGGQKQRIAIARALIRNPCVLMLDEATSALDSKSEKVVQEALDKAQASRTSIVIAHRLSTIQAADTIAVINNGQLVESGTHKELMALGGQYASLYQSNL